MPPNHEMNEFIRLTFRGRRDDVAAVLRRLGLGPADDAAADEQTDAERTDAAPNGELPS